MAASFAMQPQYPVHGTKKSILPPGLAISIVLHLVVFVGIPVLTMLVYHPTIYQRPATFQLVSAQPAPAAASVAEPQTEAAKPVVEKDITPVPKTSKTKPVPKKEKKITKPVQKTSPIPAENTDDLNELLSSIPVKSVSEIAVSQQFKFNWYLQHITSTVENHWKPPMGLTDKKNVAVVVSFTIVQNGSITRVQISESSGISALDNCALQAINASAPFPPLPIGFADKKLEVSYTLHYVKS